MDAKIQELASKVGIVFQGFDARLGMDAAFPLVTTANSGIPAMLSTFIDPKLIQILTAPMEAANAVGNEVKKGDWVTRTAMFPVIEHTGEVTSYGDYNNSGSSGGNFQFPQRQSYHFQTITQWGEKELAEAGEAKIDWAAQLNISSALALNKYQNWTYLYGVSGLANYGMLNDPSLAADLTPGTKAAGGTAWVLPSGQINATNLEVFNDVQKLFFALASKSKGRIKMTDPLKLILSPLSQIGLSTANGTVTTVTAWDLITKAYPNIDLKVVPEFSTASGEKVQLVCESVEGQRTWDCAFTEKMRAHPVVIDTSSYKQKKSAGTWGTIVYQPFAISSMLGI